MKKKGFTLIELIIVIAIIGVLMGVLIPAWGHYISRSRTRTQNLKAKTIFNAAQTFATDLKFAERRYVNILKDSTASEAKKIEANVNLMGSWDGTSTEWCIYFNGIDVGFYDPSNFTDVFDPASTVPGATMEQSGKKTILCNQSANRLRDSIKNIVNENETIYKIYVKDYKVVSVVSSRFIRDSYLGSYPLTLDDIEDKEGVSVSDIRENKVSRANMSLFGL